MKLAINYSEAAESLLNKGAIQIDIFKCPNWSWMIEKASNELPVIVHFDLQIGNRNLDNTDWQVVDQLFHETNTLYINLHLEPGRKTHSDIPADSDEPSHQDIIIERIVSEMRPIVRRYSAENIIIENAIYRTYRGKTIKVGVLPGVFRRLFNEFNCGLLLDISHARISARSLGIAEQEYISSLPIERLKEIHFTGLHNVNGKWIDHLPILEADWPILEWVLAEINAERFSRPWLFVYEYGGVGDKYIDRCDPDVIATQIPRLSKMIRWGKRKTQ